MPGPLTEVQRRVLDFVLEFQRRAGYSPTHREIKEALGYTSYGTVHKHLKLIKAKGYLTGDRCQKRGLGAVDLSERGLLADARDAIRALSVCCDQDSPSTINADAVADRIDRVLGQRTGEVRSADAATLSAMAHPHAVQGVS